MTSVFHLHNYKHHNTVKLFIACTPNGAISHISSFYAGSILDVELTRVSGLLSKLPRNESTSVMTDRGFTIRDQFNEVGVELNIPPFLNGWKQLPSNKVQEGRTIASLQIHVKRAIGRVKNYSILKNPLPLSISCTVNQIVTVCALLVNFKPVLIPLSTMKKSHVDEYLDCYYKSNNEETDLA